MDQSRPHGWGHITERLDCSWCPKSFQTADARRKHVVASVRCRAFAEKHTKELLAQRTRRRVLEDAPDGLDDDPPSGWEQEPADGETPWHRDEEGRRARLASPADPSPTIPSSTKRSREWVELFPDKSAGRALREATLRSVEGDGNGPTVTEPDFGRDTSYAGFGSLEEWQLAKWALGSGISQVKLDELLSLGLLTARSEPSFHNSRAMLQKIDALPDPPQWQCKQYTVTGSTSGEQTVEMWYRNPVEIVESLIGNRRWSQYMSYSPRKVYTTEAKDSRIYSEMQDADWWWQTQERLPADATIAPVILASDKTQLSLFSGNTSAYPVYLSIGNIARDRRRKPTECAMLLLGYLPTDKLTSIPKPQRGLAERRLFHECMSDLLSPLVKAGSEGVEMRCADDHIRRVYPIVAAYVADFPEQCLVACCKQSRCPRCVVEAKEKGNLQPSALRNPTEVAELLKCHSTSTVTEFARLCELQGLHPVASPFWLQLPHCNIFEALTPDGLHELHKGIFKDHLVSWCSELAGVTELDERFKRVPPHAGLRVFSKGISGLSQTSGSEHKDMEKVFAPLLVGNPGYITAAAQRAARALLDFIYLAHYSAHTEQSLQKMEHCLEEFHQHKGAFTRAELCKGFDGIPKLHKIQHYVNSIRLLGAADNFDSELPERLHIDFAKMAYRAGNRLDYIAHMTTYLERRERVHNYNQFITDQLPSPPTDSEAVAAVTECAEVSQVSPARGMEPGESHRLPHWPSCPRVTAAQLSLRFGIPDVIPHVAALLGGMYPHAPWQPNETTRFDAYVKVKITLPVLPGAAHGACDVVRCSPSSAHKQARLGARPSRFDTVLVNTDAPGRNGGLRGLSVGRLRCVFRSQAYGEIPSLNLAYVEWFHNPHTNAQRYAQVSKMDAVHGVPAGEVIHLRSIVRSCHLMPLFEKEVPASLTSDSVLDLCSTFVINPYVDHHMFYLMN